MGEIVQKIKDEPVDCILVGPQWPRHWRAMLQQMPIREIVVLPHWDNLCQPSNYVPRHKQHRKHPSIKWWLGTFCGKLDRVLLNYHRAVGSLRLMIM